MSPSAAKIITNSLKIPTIGIGSSVYCDGQILVTDDMLGISGFYPKFVKKYARLDTIIEKAVKKYTKDVKSKRFPKVKNFYMDQNLDKKIEFKEKLTNFYSNNRFKIYLLLFSLFIGIIVSLSLKYIMKKII